MLFTIRAQASEKPMLNLTIEQHIFTPAILTIPAHTPFTLKIENRDRTPEEFESHELKREKIIPGGTTGMVNFGSLEPGTYKFFGDFNQKTAQGTIVVQ